jgi:ribonucrease Y
MGPVLVAVAALAVGIAAGFFIRKTIAISNAQSIEAKAQKILLDAEREADESAKRSLREARDEIAAMRRDADEDVRTRRDEVSRSEARLTQAEAELLRRTEAVDDRAVELEERDRKLQFVREQLERATETHRAELEKIAGMTSSEARDQLVGQVIDEAKRTAMSRVREIEQRAREEGEERARDPARGLGADGRVHGGRVRAPVRGHEGADHRPRRPQHPGVRGDHGREPHHRRHT